MGQYIRVSSGTFTGGTVGGATDFTSTISSGGTDLSVLLANAGTNVHNDLSGIQGGQASEYYHLTASGHSYYQDFLNGTISADTNFSGTISSGGTELSTLFTPGGSDAYVQFNNSGAFGGEARFRWDATGDRLMLGYTSTPTDVGETLNVSGDALVSGSLSATSSVVITRRAIFKAPSVSLSSIGANVINCANGSIQNISVDASPVNLTYSNAEVGTYIFVFTNSGVRTVTFTTASGWYTPGGAAVSYTTSAGAVNVVTAIYDGSKMLVTSTENYTQL